MFNLATHHAHMQRAEAMGFEGSLGQLLLADIWAEALLRLSAIKRQFEQMVVVAPLADWPEILQTYPQAQIFVPHHHPDAHWPFAPQSLDLVITLGCGHWLQNWPLWLAQVQHSLKPDGLLLGCLVGGESMWQLRQVLQQTESQLCGGISPRISPMIDLPTLAALIQQAQFALPVVDNIHTTLTYKKLHTLVADLRHMGQTAAFNKVSPALSKAFWLKAEQYYGAQFGTPLPLTIDWLWFLGWAPAASQPQALRRGSGKISLVDILK